MILNEHLQNYREKRLVFELRRLNLFFLTLCFLGNFI